MMAALFGCLFAGVSTVQAQEVTPDEVGYIVKVGDEAPDFEMTLTDGQKVKLSSLRGKSCDASVYSKLVWGLP